MHYVWDEVRAWIDWHEKWQEFRRKANQLAKVYRRELDAYEAGKATY